MSQEFLKELYRASFLQGVIASVVCGGLAKKQITDENFYNALCDAVKNLKSKEKDTQKETQR